MQLLNFKNQLSTRHLLNAVALVIILYMAGATIGVISKNYELQKEVDALKSEIEFLELRNNELEYETAYYQTNSFADREARDKLGLQAPGEKLVIFPDKVPAIIASANETTTPQSAVQRGLSNFEQWLYFLFKRDPARD